MLLNENEQADFDEINKDVEETTEVKAPEFDNSQAMDEILVEKFGEKSNSDEAINFMETEEFETLMDGKKKAAGKVAATTKPGDNTIDEEEETFDLKNLDSEDYDLSNLKPAELKAAINAQNKSIRENYENNTKEIKNELEVAKTKNKETSQENKEMQEVISNLPGFLKTLGLDVDKDADLKKDIQDYILGTAAEKAGLSVKDYLAKAAKEQEALDEAATNVEKNVDSSMKDFLKDEMFSKLEINDKEEKLKNHLIDIKFDPEKGNIQKEARILFMDEYDELIKQEGINQAIENNSNGSLGKVNVKGKNKKLAYDPTKDAQFMKELNKEFGK